MIDVLVTSTCRPQFERTYRSFMEHVRCDEGFRFVVNVDVLGNKAYLPRLLDFFRRTDIHDVHVQTAGCSFAGAVNHVIGNIRGEFFFYLEDDWLFRRHIDLDAVLKMMREHPEVHQVRFSKEKIVQLTEKQLEELKKTSELYLAPGEQFKAGGIDLVETSIWSLNPHVARTTVIKQCGRVPDGINPESYFCKSHKERFGNRGLFIYGKYGDHAAVRDIGRPNILARKFRTLLTVIKDPSMISREKRMEKVIDRLGKTA